MNVERLESRATPSDLLGNPFYTPPPLPYVTPPAVAAVLLELDAPVDIIKIDWAAIWTPTVVPSSGPSILMFTTPPPPPAVVP